jgi:hypothetical protein
MEKSNENKKETPCTETPCNKTQETINCESMCREILKCIHQPVVETKVAAPKVKKEREVLEGVTEYFIFWT